MGKRELWDDSVLIKAFNTAISNYKVIHGASESTEGKTANSESPDNGSTEHVQKNDYFGSDSTVEIEEAANIEQILENPKLESKFSAVHIGSSNSKNDGLSPINENAAVESNPSGKDLASSDVKGQNELAWYSDGSEEYYQLWTKYYELEEERQKIIQQLNKYSNWNYQNPVSSTFTSEEHQASASQPYETVACYCQYGCQNWGVPCNSLPAYCSYGNCTNKNCPVSSKDAHNGNSTAEKGSDFVKTAMTAAERAISSLTKETSINGGKDKDMESGHFSESTNAVTDLSSVLNAWYSAGFYTGKYLSEQSLEKRRHG